LIPLHIGRLDVSYTNSALFMTIAVVLISALMLLGTRRAALVPGRWQSVAEMMYEFVADMVDTNAGHGARDFFPFVFTLFLFTLSIRLFANMLAGHTMLAIFGGFAASVGFLAFFPLAINIALVGLELLVAVLQAYVFAILTCLYLRDALHLH